MGMGLTGPKKPHRHIATVQAFVGNHKSMPLFDHTSSLTRDYLSLKIQGRNGLVLKQFSYCHEIESVNSEASAFLCIKSASSEICFKPFFFIYLLLLTFFILDFTLLNNTIQCNTIHYFQYYNMILLAYTNDNTLYHLWLNITYGTFFCTVLFF